MTRVFFRLIVRDRREEGCGNTVEIVETDSERTSLRLFRKAAKKFDAISDNFNISLVRFHDKE